MIFDFIKSLAFGNDWELKKITPEYLLKKKSLLEKNKYIRWLRVQVTICQSNISMIENTGKPVPQELLDKYKIIETERAHEEDELRRTRR